MREVKRCRLEYEIPDEADLREMRRQGIVKRWWESTPWNAFAYNVEDAVDAVLDRSLEGE